MGGKVLNGCRIYIGFPILAWKAKTNDWNNAKLTGWVKNAGGTIQQQFNDVTATHVVVDEKQWQNKTKTVQDALAANENGRRIHIVSPGWLESCLEEQRKCREGTYLWEKLDRVASSEKQKKRRNSGGAEGENAGRMRRAPQDMLGEVFQESTEPFVEERDRRALEAELAGERKAKKEREEAETRIKEAEKITAEQRRKERAEMMRKTAKRGRGEVFNENFHAWQDDTGFAYDTMLTKVDTLTNSNERINLTIFETNAEPHTYATNLHFAGTGKCPMNNILATMGSNLRTAMRFFRQAFQEKTGYNWDDRIKVYNERVRARESGMPNLSSARRGESVKSATKAAEDAMPFEGRYFEYMPPLRSSIGLLPNGRDEIPEVVSRMRTVPSAPIGLTDDELPRQLMETAEISFAIESDMAEIDAETADFNELFAGADPISGSNMIGADARSLDSGGLLAASEWTTQDDRNFDAVALNGEEHHFHFDPLPHGTQANQTQLAVGVGEELLNLNKRKRSDALDDAEEEVPVAKKPATRHFE